MAGRILRLLAAIPAVGWFVVLPLTMAGDGGLSVVGAFAVVWVSTLVVFALFVAAATYNDRHKPTL